MRKSDVIHLHGGKTLKLLEALKKHGDLAQLFKDKTVSGESAGAYVLSNCFYSKFTAGGAFKGIGLVPVKTICHYIGENKDKLDTIEEDLELLLLPDYIFKVYRFND